MPRLSPQHLRQCEVLPRSHEKIGRPRLHTFAPAPLRGERWQVPAHLTGEARKRGALSFLSKASRQFLPPGGSFDCDAAFVRCEDCLPHLGALCRLVLWGAEKG